jgi:Zn finger protein HypA/HybF involved in hydrogenase expression
MKKCTRKHTEYQPDEREWACPKCGATADDDPGFFSDSQEWDIEVNCDLLHGDDVCECKRCGYVAMGRTVAKKICLESKKVYCTHCHGTGWITK